MDFGIEDIPTGDDIAQQMEMLKELRRNPGSLEVIQKSAPLCVDWGKVLKASFKSVCTISNETTERQISDHQTAHTSDKMSQSPEKVIREVKNGRTVLMEVQLADGRNYIFAIEPCNGGKGARTIHAWGGNGRVRKGNTIPVEDLADKLKALTSLDPRRDSAKLREVQGVLWGKDHAEFANRRSGKNRIKMAMSGECEDIGGLCRSLETRRQSLRAQIEHFSKSTESHARAGVKGGTLKAVGKAAACEAGLGFVFGAAGLFTNTYRGSDEVDLDKVLLGAVKGGVGSGVGSAAKVIVTKTVTPTFARLGTTSFFRSNVASGAAAAGVFLIWDLVEWKAKKTTTVELRKSQAAGLAGAAGGLGVGIAAGAGAGVLFGPVGAVVGGIVGGIVGGVGGSFAGTALDEALWDASEDAVVESYEFFGWRKVPRNSHPTRSPSAMKKAYEEKLKAKPEKLKQKEWNEIVLRNVTVLINAMYPENKRLIELAAELRVNDSQSLRVAATYFYDEILSVLREDTICD